MKTIEMIKFETQSKQAQTYRIFNNLMSQIRVDEKQRNPDFGEVRDSFFLVKWLQIHSFINIFRSFSRRIQKSDLFNLGKNYWPEDNIAKFQRIKQEYPNTTLFSKIFFHFVSTNYVFVMVLISISCVLQLFGPLAIKQVITYLSETDDDDHTKAKAYTYTWILILCYFVKIFVDQYTNRLLFMAGLRVNQVLHHQLLCKFSRMSFDRKIKTQKIYLANNMIIDCDMISAAISKSGIIFSLPITALLVQIFLLLEFQYYAFSFLGSFLLGITIQILIDKKISSKKLQLMAIQYEKYGMNCQFVKSFKQMRMLGWKDLIISKNQSFRKKENNTNSTIYKLKGLFDLAGNLIPLIAVLMTLGLYFTIHDHKEIDAVIVFTIITYCGLISNINEIYEPLEGFKSLKRIQKQLQAQELRFSQTYDSSMQKGRLVLNNLVAKWKLQGVTLENIQDMMLLEKRALIIQSDDEEEEDKLKQDQKQKHQQVHQKVNINKSEYKVGTYQGFQINDSSLTKNLLSEQNSENQLKLEINHLKQVRINKIKQKVRKQFEQLQILNQFEFQENRLIVMGGVESGKSSFLHLIMGNLNIESGYAKYGGKVGYMPQNIWFKRQSVRQNILFGSLLDVKWLKTVYQWLDMREQMKLLDDGDRTIINQNLFMTQKQKKKIALARAIYCRPDILILDEPFLFLDSEKSKILYQKISNQFKDKIIVISTKSTEFVNQHDHMLIIDCGKIVESSSYQQIKNNPKSLVHKIYQKSLGKINIISTQTKELTILQKKKRTKRLKMLKQKVKKFVNYLLEITKGKTRQQIDQIIEQRCGIKKSEAAAAQNQLLTDRLGPVPLQSAKRLFNIYPSFYLLLIAVSVMIQSIFVYSMYWIGEQQLPFHINYNTQLIVYFCLTVFYGLFWCLSSLIVPHLSATVANSIVSDVTRSVAYMQYSKAIKQAYLIPTLTLNKPNDSYYNLNNAIQNITFGYITLLISIVLVSISSPIFIAVGTVISIIYFICQVYLLRAERQIHYFQFYQYPITSIYQQTITGIETLRAFQRIDQHINRSKFLLYNQSVYRANHQFIFHGISIVCKLLGLVLLTGAIYLALSAKQRVSSYSIGLLGASITFILDLSTMLNQIITEAVDLSNILFDTIQQDFDVIDQPIDTAFLFPEKPNNWPIDGSIEFKNAEITGKIFDEPTMKNLTMRIESGQQIAMFGSDDIGKVSIIYSLLRYYTNENQQGFIKVGDCSVFDIGRKYLLEEIRVLSSDPFSFKGSVRQNVDPFQQYIDNQIIQVLQKTKVWDKLQIPQQSGKDTSENRLNQLFTARVRYDVLQRVNIARALLKNPKIIIATSITDSLGRKSAMFLQQLLMSELKKSTKIFITQNRDTIIKTDKVAYIEKSRLKDFGPPIEILNKRYKITAKKQVQQKIEQKMEKQESKKQIEAQIEKQEEQKRAEEQEQEQINKKNETNEGEQNGSKLIDAPAN